MNIFYTILILIGFIILFGVGWHFASERLQLLCPSWLGWMVQADNSYLDLRN